MYSLAVLGRGGRGALGKRIQVRLRRLKSTGANNRNLEAVRGSVTLEVSGSLLSLIQKMNKRNRIKVIDHVCNSVIPKLEFTV